MASSAKACFLLFLLTILSSQQILARDSQFFNKIPSNYNNNNNAVTDDELNKQQPTNKLEEEPNFIPENENGGYGLYGHESGQLPPSTTNGEPYKKATNIPYNSENKDSFPNSKYLPKNYNTEAYVTEPESYTPTTTTPENNNNHYSQFSIPNSKYLPKNYNTESYVTEPEGYRGPQEYNNNNYNGDSGENGYYNNKQQEYNSANGNNYYGNQQQGHTNANGNNNYGVNNYNSFAQSGYTTTGTGGNNYGPYNGENSNGYQKQGMSDTRYLENGKYFYDINLEKSTFNPNENTGAFGYHNEYNNRGYYSHNKNSYEYNTNGRGGYNGYNTNGRGGYNGPQNQEEFQNFQDEEDMP